MPSERVLITGMSGLIGNIVRQHLSSLRQSGLPPRMRPKTTAAMKIDSPI